MLCFIKDKCSRNDEVKFIRKYEDFLVNNLISMENIYKLYEFIKLI